MFDLWLAVAVAGVMFIAGVIAVRRSVRYAIGFFAGVLGVFLAYCAKPAQPILPEDSDSIYVIEGEVTDVLDSDEVSFFVMRVDSMCTSRGTKLEIMSSFRCAVTWIGGDGMSGLLPGDGVQVKCTGLVSVPETPLFEGDRNYTSYFISERISSRCFAEGGDVIVTGYTDSFIRRCAMLRDDLKEMIYSSPLNHKTAYFLSAVLLGDDGDLDMTTVEQYRGAGLAHLLALSGFHLAMIIAILSFIMLPFKLCGRYSRIRFVVIMLSLWGYVCVTGMSASIVRAATIATIYLLGRLLQRDSNPLNSLATAAIVIMLADPPSIFSPGFQLSFAAVFSILAFSEVMNPFSQRYHPKLHKFATWFIVPVSAMIGTGVLSAFYFHSFPVFFLLSNLVAVWLMPLIAIGGVALIMSALIGIDPAWICKGLDFTVGFLNHLASWIANNDMAEIKGLLPSVIFTVTLLAAVIAAGFYVNQRSRMAGYAMAVFAVLAVVTGVFEVVSPQKQSEVIELDSGKSKIWIVRDGNTIVALTDAAERYRKSKLRHVNDRMKVYYDYYGSLPPDTLIGLDYDFRLPGVLKTGNVIKVGDKEVILRASAPAKVQ